MAPFGIVLLRPRAIADGCDHVGGHGYPYTTHYHWQLGISS